MINRKGVPMREITDKDAKFIFSELSDICSDMDNIVEGWHYDNLDGYTTQDIIFDLREYIDSFQEIIYRLKQYNNSNY